MISNTRVHTIYFSSAVVWYAARAISTDLRISTNRWISDAVEAEILKAILHLVATDWDTQGESHAG